VPDNISPLPLPPYSPELNPQENIWQFLRQIYLANRIDDTYVALVDACCEAWNDLIATPGRIKSSHRVGRLVSSAGGRYRPPLLSTSPA
jgi:hypothetical protein